MSSQVTSAIIHKGLQSANSKAHTT